MIFFAKKTKEKPKKDHSLGDNVCVVNSVTLHITYRLFGLITVYMTVFGLSDLKHCGGIFSLARGVYFCFFK